VDQGCIYSQIEISCTLTSVFVVGRFCQISLVLLFWLPAIRCVVESVMQEVKKEKPVAPAEPVKVRAGGGVGVSELRNKLGNMMVNAAAHPPAGPGTSIN